MSTNETLLEVISRQPELTFTPHMLSKQLHLNYNNAKGACRRLYLAGKIDRIGRGRYRSATRTPPQQKRTEGIRQHRVRVRLEILMNEGAYVDKLLEQHGCCAICGTKPITRRLARDHDHTTGAIRGLLCGPCNTALERVEHIDNWGAKAQAYLQQYTREQQ